MMNGRTEYGTNGPLLSSLMELISHFACLIIYLKSRERLLLVHRKVYIVSKHQGMYINLQYGCEQIFSFFTYFVLVFGNFVTSKHVTIIFPFLYYWWLVYTEKTSSTLSHTQLHVHPNIFTLLTSFSWYTLTTRILSLFIKVFHVRQMCSTSVYITIYNYTKYYFYLSNLWTLDRLKGQ
jgi:hypothetical protein